MKKVYLSAVCFFTGCLMLSSGFQITQVSAQDNAIDTSTSFASTTDKNLNDKDLAALIQRLTNRSTEGLTENRKPDGEIFIDLENQFQNVMLAKAEADGDVAAACVTSLGEANAFFGRNLETGDAVSSAMFQKDDAAALAARHGMSAAEFGFYSNLIAEAERHQQRAFAPNAAIINIVNSDGANEGFNDPAARTPEGGNNGATLGAQRLNLFNFAAGIWGEYLDSSVPVNISAQFNSLAPCSTGGGVLGSAGPNGIYANFTNARFANTFYPTALANKQSGSDRNGASAEISTQFNSDVDTGCLGAGTRFYYGLNNSTPAGTINLTVVLLHEMGHGFGSLSFADGNSGNFPGGLPDIWARFMFDRTANLYWNQMTAAQRVTSARNNGNLLWDGASVKAASGFLTAGRDADGRVQLFAPAAFQSGSSVSHWDTAASPNLLMEPSINRGLPLTLDLTRQQMRDIGWYRDSNGDTVPDTITNVQQSGRIVIGNPATITWTNTGGFSRNITIELSADGGATFPTTIAADVPNTGSYTFTVPNTPTAQGRFRVREANFFDPVNVSTTNFAIGTPTAAAVSIGGRVLSPSGSGIAKARVTLTDGNGGAARLVTTDLRGYYRFDNVAAAQLYLLAAQHKRFLSASQTVSVNDAIDDLNIILPQ